VIEDAFLDRIVRWADRHADIRALILTGSRARPDKRLDSFSDYDVEVFTTELSKYEAKDDWMWEIGNVWVCLPLSSESDDRYRMRLVVFEEGRKVDFGFAPTMVLEETVAAGKLSELYERGYHILLDRDGLASRLPMPSYAAPVTTLPSEAAFRAAVEEFWFEAFHIPWLLLRNELWVVKMRDWTMKQLLLTMIEWHAVATRGKQQDIWHIGTRMASWTTPQAWERLHDVFGRFEVRDSWRALLATTGLYRDLASEAAEALDYTYPSAVDRAISEYIRGFESELGRSSVR
jgi:aminoglycoside 6-adenylyltransferase